MQKRFNYYIVTLLLSTLLLAACGTNTPVQSECRMSIVSPGDDYTRVILWNASGEKVDSADFDDGDMCEILLADSLSMPWIGLLRFYNQADAMDVVEIPVAVEGGAVSVDLSETIGLSGTPLNMKLRDFLVARSRLRHTLDKDKNPDMTIDDLRRLYSAFYVEQINRNAGTVVGDFLKNAYGCHILPQDRDKIL